jgi:dipeptidyl aminopeptidase/acylaminoacyl peptidase
MGTANDGALEPTQTASHDTGRQPRSVPARVGRYVICEELGTGAMGVVYRARDPELDRSLAIKLVRTDGKSRARGARLLREAQAMAKLRHPNVVPIFDVGPAEGAGFVAMPLLEGGTLRGWLRSAPRSLDDVLDRFVAAGRGLAAAHAAGLVHRDFKPDNVLLGEAGEVQVADFGLARVAEPTAGGSGASFKADAVTEVGDVVGTPAYMAPEQLRARPSDARADQFSFCVALWESAFDERPFGKPEPSAPDPLRARLDAIAAGPIPPRRDRPAWLARVLERGLAAAPERRWPSMDALLESIARHRASRRGPWRVAAALGAIALAAAVFVVVRPAPVGRVFPVVALTHRSDLHQAAISPDGARLALVAGDALLVRGIEADTEDRVLLDRGVADVPLSWSPDGRHLLVATAPEVAPVVDTQIIDLDGGERHQLPTPGMATFLSSTEVAVTAFRRRSVAILSLGPHSITTTAICDVPGDYTFLWRVVGMPDGTMVVQTLKGEVYGLVFLRRDCSIRARFATEPIASIAATDAATIVALVLGEGSSEILELTLDGVVRSRRRVSGDLSEVLGRRHGVDYVSTIALKTHLVRARAGAPIARLLSISGSASFSLAPDGATVAWIETGSRARGRLRLASVAKIARGGPALLDNALMVGWSPDGRSLAVLVDQGSQAGAQAGAEVGIAIIDRTGAVLRPLPLHRLERTAAPVWLDDHRVAAQTDDRTTYRWFDLATGEQGEITDRQHGSTYWLARSPRDGMLAMWRNGPPDPGDARPEHLWIQPAGGAARPLHVDAAVRYHLLPSWSPSGDLLVRALETGAVSSVALDTGALAPVAQLPPTPVRTSFDDHVMTLADGDLLAVEIELGIDVLAVRPDDTPLRARRREPDPGQL